MRVRDVPHVVRKSNQFSLVPNRRGNVSHRRACRPACHPFSAHIFVVLVSEFFQRVGKSREKGICFEFMLWILNEFLRVFFLQGGLTGFRFKLLMNDGVDWVSRFTRLVLYVAKQEPRPEDGEPGRQGRRRWRASAITFLMPDHARDEFPEEEGCAKT